MPKSGHKACVMSQRDNDVQLYTLVNGVIGICDGTANLEDIPSLGALLEFEELSVDKFSYSIKNGDLSEVVVIRPDIIDLNSSSLLDEAVLEDTKAVLIARSGSSVLKTPRDPFYPLVKECQDVVCHDPPSVLPPDRGFPHELTWFLGRVTRQCPLPKEKCDVTDDSSVIIMR